MKGDYVWALDISMSSTGVAIFKNMKLIDVFHISTNPKELIQERLCEIANVLFEYKEKYPPFTIVMERGFTRFNTATQVIYRVVGLVNYLFANCEQIYIAPKKIKMIVTGKGNSKKEIVAKKILEIYNVSCATLDESDAIAIGYTYFKENGDIV